MLQEPDEVASKRKRCRELLRAYQQAFKVASHNTLANYFTWCLLNLYLNCLL